MCEDDDILLCVLTEHRIHGSAKALRGLMSRLTAHDQLSRTMKKGRYRPGKRLRAKPWSCATVVLMEVLHDLNAGVHAMGYQLRRFERFGLFA